jgi:hypothetical protein
MRLWRPICRIPSRRLRSRSSARRRLGRCQLARRRLASIQSGNHPRRLSLRADRPGLQLITVIPLLCQRAEGRLWQGARVRLPLGTRVQHDPHSRAKYATLRLSGHGHAHALRSVGDT